MFKLITLCFMLFALFTLSSITWVSATLYTLFSILQPQYVWFWAFDGLPAFKIFAALAILAFIINAVKGNVDYRIYKLPINKALLVLTVMLNLAEFFTRYPSSYASELVIGIFNTTMLLYAVCLGCVTSEKAIQYLCYAFIITGVYYAYDGNSAYFGGDWGRFNSGRLGGPANGAYSDNNKFAILMVVCFPFLLYGFFFCKSKTLKALSVLGMLLIMHCIFLTGSRGALLSLGAAVFISSKSIKSKLLSYAIVLAFIIVVIDQAGGTLSRGKEVVTNQQNEQVANPRIKSWTVGLKLMIHYPLLGTGVYRFLNASVYHYPGETPHVAHNTFITFSVNGGLICGFAYLYLFYACHKMRRAVIAKNNEESIASYAANSTFAGLVGFFVGAIFLDMIIFEPLYYLIMILAATYYYSVRKAELDEQGAEVLNREKTKHWKSVEPNRTTSAKVTLCNTGKAKVTPEHTLSQGALQLPASQTGVNQILEMQKGI